MNQGVIIACFWMFVCIGHTTVFAQQPSPRFSVAVSPVVFIPVTIAAQVSLQARVSKRCAVLVEAAVPTFQPNNTEYETIRSLRTGFEFKYFLKETTEAANYISLQSQYLFRQLTDHNSSNYYTRTATFFYSDATIDAPVLALAVKWGREIVAGKRTYVDVFAGAGLRMVFTKYATKGAIATATAPPMPGFFDYDAAWKYNYSLTRPHVTAGFRFGFRL